MMRKRWLPTGVAGLATVLLLAGCSPQPSGGSTSSGTSVSNSSTSGSGGAASQGSSTGAPSAASTDQDKPVTLTVWGWNQDQAAAYQKVLSLYTKDHPNVTVKYIPYQSTDYDTILKTGLAGAEGPDVAMLRSYGGMQTLVDSGDLVDLTGKVSGLSAFPKAVLDGATASDGNIYGVPFAVQTLNIFYNKSIFAKYKLSAPTTWDQMMSDAKTLKDNDVIPFASVVSDNWMLPVEQEIFGATRYGGPAFEAKLLSGQAKFTDPDWVASVSTWLQTQKYWEPNYAGTGYNDAKALFMSGKAAMYPGGIYELANFQENAPDLKLGLFSAPPAPGAVVDHALTPGYVDGSFGISAKSSHQQAALDLVNWMATPAFGQAYANDLKQLSPVPGITIDEPLLQQAADDYAKNPSPYITYDDFNYGTPTGWSVSCEQMQKAALGTETAAQAAAALQKSVDQWFKPKS